MLSVYVLLWRQKGTNAFRFFYLVPVIIVVYVFLGIDQINIFDFGWFEIF